MGISEDNWVDLVVRIKADSCLVAFHCCCFNYSIYFYLKDNWFTMLV